jgi:S1-C subfamily serine protease
MCPWSAAERTLGKLALVLTEPRRSLIRLLIVAVVVLVASCGSGSSASIDAIDSAVRVSAEGCRARPRLGGGSVIAPDRVVTVAHVVAGANEISVTLPDGSTVDAEVVAIERTADLAILSLETGEVPVMNIGVLDAGDDGELVVHRAGEAIAQRFTTVRAVDIRADDIDKVDRAVRSGYEIEATIEPGDSGAVLVVDGGRGFVE